jgi:hypothetical protein
MTAERKVTMSVSVPVDSEAEGAVACRLQLRDRQAAQGGKRSHVHLVWNPMEPDHDWNPVEPCRWNTVPRKTAEHCSEHCSNTAPRQHCLRLSDSESLVASSLLHPSSLAHCPV